MIAVKNPYQPIGVYAKRIYNVTIKKNQLTLSEKDVAHSFVDVVDCWVSTVDHQAIDELHRLGSLPSQLSGDDNFTTLSTALHDES